MGRIVLETRYSIRNNIGFTRNMFRCKLDVVSHTSYNELPGQVHGVYIF